MLLKSGADTNLAMTDGRTPLHIAAECGSLAVLKLLLAHDADPLQNDGVCIPYVFLSDCIDSYERLNFCLDSILCL